MRDLVRWAIVVGLVLVVIGFVAYARGDEHHRGDDVGALGSVTVQRA
jgi:hypothetical protein